MGMPTSHLTPAQIHEQFGQVVSFQPPQPGHQYHDGLAAGQITDDTEQSLALARSFIRLKHVDPHDIVSELMAWAKRSEGRYASILGPSTERAINLLNAGIPLHEAGKTGDTNGAAMRIAPLGIIHGVRGSSLDDLVRDVEQACLPTHGTNVAISSAAAVAWSIAVSFNDSNTVEDALEAAIQAAKSGQRRGNAVSAPSIAKRLEWIAEMISKWTSAQEAISEIYDFFGAGVAAADSIPAAIGAFVVARGDPKQTILFAANMGGDCDTVAAMAGAIAGAFAGSRAIPGDWAQDVQRINSLRLEDTAQALVSLAPEWNAGQ
jgi:ADP-ribosylglycohydrolase